MSCGGRLGRRSSAFETWGNDVDDLKFGIGDALGTDYFFLKEQMTTEQLDYLLRIRELVDHEVLPVINGYWERAEFTWPLVERQATLGIVGDGIDGYGCPPMDPLSTAAAVTAGAGHLAGGLPRPATGCRTGPTRRAGGSRRSDGPGPPRPCGPGTGRCFCAA
jgi:hypothetical protein